MAEGTAAGEAEEPEIGGEGFLWQVVGGVDAGGILVRQGAGLKSEAEPMRLATGAIVRQVSSSKERLLYSIVTGSGPARGWVSLRVSGKELLRPFSDEARPPPIGRKKIRVLALHGGGSNARIMEYQTMALRKALGDRAEWRYLDGRRIWETDQKPDEMMVALAKGEPFRGWYAVTNDGPKDADYNAKLFDPSVNFTYDEVEKGVEYVQSTLEKDGPFDVVVAFSQGCVIAHLVAALIRERGDPMPWRLSVLFAGMKVRDGRYERLFEEPLEVPCLQIYGRQDPFYDYGMKSQPQMYQNPVLLEHDEAHRFPVVKPAATELYERVIEEMLWHCGMTTE